MSTGLYYLTAIYLSKWRDRACFNICGSTVRKPASECPSQFIKPIEIETIKEVEIIKEVPVAITRTIPLPVTSTAKPDSSQFNSNPINLFYLLLLLLLLAFAFSHWHLSHRRKHLRSRDQKDHSNPSKPANITTLNSHAIKIFTILSLWKASSTFEERAKQSKVKALRKGIKSYKAKIHHLRASQPWRLILEKENLKIGAAKGLLEIELKHTEARHSELQIEYEKTRSQLDERDKIVGEASKILDGVMDKLQSEQGRIQEKDLELDELKIELNENREYQSSVQEMNEDLRNENSGLKAKSNELQDELIEKSRKVEDLQKDSDLLSGTRENLDIANERVANLEVQLNDSKVQINDLETQIKNLQTSVDSLQNFTKQEENQLAKAETESQTFTEGKLQVAMAIINAHKLRQDTLIIQSLKDARNFLESSNTMLAKENETLKSHKAELERNGLVRNNEIALHNEIAKLKWDYETLNMHVKSLVGNEQRLISDKTRLSAQSKEKDEQIAKLQSEQAPKQPALNRGRNPLFTAPKSAPPPVLKMQLEEVRSKLSKAEADLTSAHAELAESKKALAESKKSPSQSESLSAVQNVRIENLKAENARLRESSKDQIDVLKAEITHLSGILGKNFKLGKRRVDSVILDDGSRIPPAKNRRNTRIGNTERADDEAKEFIKAAYPNRPRRLSVSVGTSAAELMQHLTYKTIGFASRKEPANEREKAQEDAERINDLVESSLKDFTASNITFPTQEKPDQVAPTLNLIQKCNDSMPHLDLDPFTPSTHPSTIKEDFESRISLWTKPHFYKRSNLIAYNTSQRESVAREASKHTYRLINSDTSSLSDAAFCPNKAVKGDIQQVVRSFLGQVETKVAEDHKEQCKDICVRFPNVGIEGEDDGKDVVKSKKNHNTKKN